LNVVRTGKGGGGKLRETRAETGERGWCWSPWVKGGENGPILLGFEEAAGFTCLGRGKKSPLSLAGRERRFPGGREGRRALRALVLSDCS